MWVGCDIPVTVQQKTTNEPTLNLSVHQSTEDMGAEEGVKNERPYAQHAEPPQGLPQSNGAEAISGDEEAPESEQARIECLGRERPAKFMSFGAELAFCYSVIASQFMSVRIVAAALTREYSNSN